MLEGFLRYKLLEVVDPGNTDSSVNGYRSFIVSPYELSGGNPENEIMSSFVPGIGNAKEFPAR
jgi:hypothetical protein